MKLALVLVAGAYAAWYYQEKLGLVLYHASMWLNPGLAEATALAAEIMGERIAENMVILDEHRDRVARRAQRQ